MNKGYEDRTLMYIADVRTLIQKEFAKVIEAIKKEFYRSRNVKHKTPQFLPEKCPFTQVYYFAGKGYA